MYEWLKNLKPGDQVILNTRYCESIETVERLTKTQIILKNVQSKFRTHDGFQIGPDIWSSKNIEYATEERIKLIKEKNRKQYLIKKIEAKYRTANIDQLEIIFSILYNDGA